MFSKAPVITDTGITLMLRAANGTKIKFTKFQIGSGFLDPGETPKAATALKNVVIDDISITDADDTIEQGYIKLEGKFDNQHDVEENFLWTEVGLIAEIDDEGEDDDGTEYLYAYGYDAEYAELIMAGETATIVEQNFSVIIAIGDTENITAYVLPAQAYATLEDFNAHLADHDNPHQVLYSQIGAAAASHNHSTNDITSGILPITRGGTGVNTLDALRALVGANYVIGFFKGTGTLREDITLGFKPSRVVLFAAYREDYIPLGAAGTTSSQVSDVNRAGFVCTFAEGENYIHKGCAKERITWDADRLLNVGHGGAAVTETGFAVGCYPNISSANTYAINRSDMGYLYIAFRP